MQCKLIAEEIFRIEDENFLIDIRKSHEKSSGALASELAQIDGRPLPPGTNS